MLRIGLTGGIGSGKSAVARLLAQRGAVVIDADAIAREVVAPGTPGLAAVVDAFGTGMLDSAGALDRPRLAALVFADDRARERLNAIVHPRVGDRVARLAAAAPADAIVVHDLPLLAENGRATGFDLVVVVETPEQVRAARLRRDRGMDDEQIRARMAAQASDADRRRVADVVLDNTGTLDDLAEQVDLLWRERVLPLRPPRPAAGSALGADVEPRHPAQP